jgi:hypothetical protein
LDTEDYAEERGAGEQDAEDVERVRVLRLPVGHQDQGHHDRDDADRHVDEEDPFPAEVLDQDTAQGAR